MSETTLLTSQVYGISNDYIDSYINRSDVDEEFLDGLDSNKHIIIYGSSKQGKSSLIRNHVIDDQKIIIECSPRHQLIDIYKSLLRQLNVEILETTTSEKGGEIGGKASVKAKLKIPFISEGEAKVEADGKVTRKNIYSYKQVEYDLSLAQDISEIIDESNYEGRIVIENFHYLSMDAQKDLAYDLRTFDDKNILFIILGIWKERNRLTQFNGDLTDRLIEVPVEPWKNEDFEAVIKEGEPSLNVSFEKISANIIANANGSIGVLQELCKYSCIKAGVKKTNHSDTIYLEQIHLDQAIHKKIGDYSSRHIKCLEDFISGDDSKLNLPFYFVQAILEFPIEELEKGLNKTLIETKIEELKQEETTIRQTDYNRFFNHIVTYQIRKDISPPLFEFDKGSQEIKIIDSTFIFFIRHKNRQELMNCFCKPT